MNQIFIEAKNLICNDGEVWLWKSDNMETVNCFATKEDAQIFTPNWIVKDRKSVV